MKRWMEAFVGSLPIWSGMIVILLSVVLWDTYHVPYESLRFVAFLMGLVVGLLLILLGAHAYAMQRRMQHVLLFNRTERERTKKVYEDEKEKYLAVIQHSQKLQAIGTFAGGIAHDFNNILYAMMGYIALSREDVPRDSLVYENLGKALVAAERGEQLIASILSFSREQRPRALQCTNLVAVLIETFFLLDPGLPDTVHVEKAITLKDAWVLGDAGQLEQVIINLVNNAVDAVAARGTVRIVLEKDAAAEQYCVRVEDTGEGMSESTLQRIFEPFFTTKEVGSGTGLGLSMAHGIIEEHGGRIDVSSTLGVGTTFTIRLPIMKGEKHGQDSIS